MTTITLCHLYLRLFVLLLCGASLPACSSDLDTLDPKTLPYRLELRRELGRNVQTVDFNGDGVDEIVGTYIPSAGPANVQAIWLKTNDGQILEQVNYEGRILPVHFKDLDDDGILEMFVPFLRNDSLFLSIVNSRGEKQASFFLFNGEARREPDGVIPWDPNIYHLDATDINADGLNELVIVATTGYARHPRGVFIYSLPEGSLLGHNLVGASLRTGFMGDFNGDGLMELVLGSNASNNGASLGGLDDRESYVLVFDLIPRPTLTKAINKGQGANTHIMYEDFNRDGTSEFLVLTTSAKQNAVRLGLIEPGSWRTVQQRSITAPLIWAQSVDLNRDARPEILMASSDFGEVWVLDAQFDVLLRRRVMETIGWLEISPDLDGDGIDEILVSSGNDVLFLEPDLRVKASFVMESPGRLYTPTYQFATVMRSGTNMPPLLLFSKNDMTLALELVANRFWWFYRYGPYALWVLGLTAILGLGLIVHTLYQRNRLLQHIYPAAFATATNGLLVLDAQGHVVLINTTLCNWLGFDTPSRVEQAHYDEVFAWIPALVSFLHQVLTRKPLSRYDEEFSFNHNDQEAIVHASAAPVPLPNSDRPFWLISFHKGKRDAAYLDAQTWAMMAKKVTHDIKNPLTNILLTAQRLQTEYRRRVPEEAAVLDAYTERIIERVTSLRRMTKQFMKILDAEALDLVKTDLNDFVQNVLGTLAQDLPPSIELVCKPQPGLPGTRVDREQMHTVLENLVANAIHALPGGGVITFSTYSVSNLRSPHARYEPNDYLVLEVQDNGTGMSEADRKRIFEPGFTTSEFGTGLGLVLVQKIVEQHSGFIEVESEQQVGTVFSIHLPVAAS